MKVKIRPDKIVEKVIEHYIKANNINIEDILYCPICKAFRVTEKRKDAILCSKGHKVE